MSGKTTEFVTGGRSEAARYSVAVSALLVAPLVILLLFGFFIPLMRLVSQSFFAPHFTLEQYERVASEALFLRVFLRTFSISAICVIGSLLLGYPIAMALARIRPVWRLLLLGCVFIPLWTSVLSRSYAWVIMLQRRGIVNDLLVGSGIVDQPLRLLYTDSAMILAMVHILLPFMILPVYNAIEAIPADLPRAARNLGAGPWKTFTEVILPLSFPGMFAGSLMVFILSIGFYVAPAIIGGSTTLVLSTLIGQQMTVQLNWPLAGALSTVLLLVTFSLTVAFRRFLVLGQRGV